MSGDASSSAVLITNWERLSVPSEPKSIESVLPATFVHNTLYRVLLRATDKAGNVFVNRTGCVLVDKTQPIVSTPVVEPDQVLDVGGDLYLKPSSSVDAQELKMMAVVTNDVSGVAAIDVCCGTIADTCDVPIANVTHSHSLESLPTSLSVTTTVAVGSNLDGFQVCP